MSRRRREKAILSLISDETVRTQAELVEALRELGIEASQSTISRDVKRLGLVKVPAGDGGYRYGRPAARRTPEAAEERLREVVDEFVTATAAGRAILAVKTPPGGANAVAAALDRAGLDGVEATLAGDDTVFLLVRDREALNRTRRRIEGWL